MRTLQLEFVIDLSGSPGRNSYFGMVSFNKFTKNAILNQFYQTFPDVSKKKGNQLNREKMLQIINFLDEHHVKMFIFPFTSNDWHFHASYWSNEKEVYEKLGAIMYYHLFKQIARKNLHYDILSCRESQIGKIGRIFHHCGRLANMQKISFNYSYAFDAYNRDLKIADFIAYSGQILKQSELAQFENYTIVDEKPPKWYFKVIFS